MLTIQVLKRARKLLRKGWCQENSVMWDEKKRPEAYCILGATSFAAEGRWPEEAHAARRRVREVLGEEQSILGFNDEPGRKKEEVLDVMDRAIKLEEAGLPWWQRVLW